MDEEPSNLPPRACQLAGALRAQMRRHGPGYTPAGPGRGAPGGEVANIPVLTLGSLDNAMIPVLAGNRFVAHVPGGVIRGLQDRVLGGRGVLYIGAEDLAAHGAARVVHLHATPRLVAQINGVRVSTAFCIMGGAAAGLGADQEERVLPVEKEARPVEKEPCADCDGAVALPDRDAEQHFVQLEGHEVPLHLHGEDGRPEAADGARGDEAVAEGMGGDEERPDIARDRDVPATAAVVLDDAARVEADNEHADGEAEDAEERRARAADLVSFS